MESEKPKKNAKPSQSTRVSKTKQNKREDGRIEGSPVRQGFNKTASGENHGVTGSTFANTSMGLRCGKGCYGKPYFSKNTFCF